MADEERSDSIQSVELPSDMLVLLSNGTGQPGQMDIGSDLTTIDGIPGFQPTTLNDLNTPRLNIIEQPKSRGFRFRYGCEGPSHGGLPGVNSQKGSRGKKTYPSIEIQNYKGLARIVVSLVTNDEVPKPHAHSLVGKNCTNGLCTVQVGPADMTATFPNLGILHVTRKDVKKVLKERMLEHQKAYQSLVGNNTSMKEAEKQVDKQAAEAAKNMDLSVVRLCYQAYLPDSAGNFTRALTPVISVPVYDCKAPNAATLKICRMDKSSGVATGGDEVYLLCDKVQKEDIQVRFFEMSSDGAITWEAYADFGPTDVHRQYAIVFKTPAYRNPNIDKQMYVQVQLKRRTDGDVSDPKPFTYFPREHDREYIQRKRKKPLPHFSDHFPSRSGFGSTSGSSGTGFRSNSGFQFPSTTVGNFNFSQSSSNFQSLPATTANTAHQPHVQVQHNSISQQQMQQQIQFQQQVRQQQLQQQQQQPQLHQQQQQQRQQQLSGMYQSASGTILQPRGLGGRSPTVVDASDGDHVVPDFKDAVKTKDEMVVEEDDLETDSAAVVMKGTLEVDSAPFDSDEFEDKQQKNRRPLAKFIGQETVTNIEEEEFTKGLPATKLEDSGMQTDMFDIEYDSLAWRLAERTSNAMRDYAVTADIKMLLAVQRHLTAVEDDNGDTALHLAIIHKRYDVAFALLSVIISIPKQKVVNHYNKLKQTPLHLATLTDQPRMVDLLLRCGADPNMFDADGNMPLHIAAKEGFSEITQILCNGPVSKPVGEVIDTDINIRNLDGFTAAHLSIKKEDLKNLKVLVRLGADVNVPDGKSGCTCLHQAVQKANFSLLGYLITDADADIHAMNFAGDTPLHIASSLDYVAVASLLIAAGADVHCENYDFGGVEGEEEDGDKDGKELLRKKIEGEEFEECGKTALDLAKSERMRKVLQGEPYIPHESMIMEADPLKGKRNEFMESGYKSHTPEPSTEEDQGKSYKGITLSFEGDLHRVDLVARKKLSLILDKYSAHNLDWKGVAEKVGLSNMVNNLRLTNSPTTELLKHYEQMDGTVEELLAVLTDLKRQDAVEVLKQCVLSKPGKPIDTRYDSTFGTLEESVQDMSLTSAT